MRRVAFANGQIRRTAKAAYKLEIRRFAGFHKEIVMALPASALRELIRKHGQRSTIQSAAKDMKLSTSTVKKYFDRIFAAELTWEKAKSLSDEALVISLQPTKRAIAHYAEPDWDKIHLRHRGSRIPLKSLWNQYISDVGNEQKALSYAAFCRNYEAFAAHLPISLAEISAAFEWAPGEVVMIDYSGDPMYLVDPKTGERHSVQIFVAVLPYSNYTFCYATPQQTRDDWLDALVELMNFLGGVPQYIYLDNSTSLVVKADAVAPKVCDAFAMLCEHYGTTPFPVTPNKPRHKAAVEGAVRLIQERCIRPLAGHPFGSINDLNNELRLLCKQHNNSVFTEKWRQTRQARFDEEKPYLNPLPPTSYEKSQIMKTRKVRKDCLIRLDDRRYSVPSGYVGQKVRIIIQPRAKMLKILSLNGEFLAQHPLRDDAHLCINVEHLPEPLREIYLSVPERRDRVAMAGPNAAMLADALAKLKKHVAAKQLRGLLRELRRYGTDDFEKICACAVEHKNLTWEGYQQAVAEVMNNGQEDQRRKVTRNVTTVIDPNRNIRGADYYKRKG